MADIDQARKAIAELLARGGEPQVYNPPVDPRIQFYRAGANADEGFGFNSIARATGLNLSPRFGINGILGGVPGQNKIQEAFRQFPGYY